MESILPPSMPGIRVVLNKHSYCAEHMGTEPYSSIWGKQRAKEGRERDRDRERRSQGDATKKLLAEWDGRATPSDISSTKNAKG